MQVTAIGAGNMGRGIGHRLVAGGHSVTIVDRDPEEAGQLAEELRSAAEGGANVDVAGPGSELRGEVVVDISNPLNQTFDALATAPGTSAAEEVAATMPAGTRVVKAFDTTFSGTLVEGQVAGQPLDVLLAGDDHDGRTYDVTGSEAITLHQVAEGLSRVTGRSITYHAETLEEAYASRASYGAPEDLYRRLGMKMMADDRPAEWVSLLGHRRRESGIHIPMRGSPERGVLGYVPPAPVPKLRPR